MTALLPLRAILVFAAAAALAGCGDGESRMAKGLEEGLRTSFVESFGESCRAAAEGGGAAAGLAAEVCKCAADELIKKYSASELIGLSPEMAAPVMKSCAAKSGLPV
jgi:hypothetical protein